MRRRTDVDLCHDHLSAGSNNFRYRAAVGAEFPGCQSIQPDSPARVTPGTSQQSVEVV